MKGVDPEYYVVPCGHCQECLRFKSFCWYVRLYYEYQNCMDHRGFVYYLTLTYNDAHLPHVDFGNGIKYPCFSKSDIQKYLKRVRRVFNVPDAFRYFVVSEFGSETHRPHYHILFFVNDPSINCNQFRNVARSKWSAKPYEIGFTKPGKFNEGIVINYAALSYVTKYLRKDIFESEYINKMKMEICEYVNSNFDAMSDEELEAFNKKYSQLDIFHLQSKGLGIYALSVTDYQKLVQGKLDVWTADVGGISSVTLPQYYERKVFFDVYYRRRGSTELTAERQYTDDVPVYVPNNSALERSIYKYKDRLNTETDRINKILGCSFADGDAIPSIMSNGHEYPSVKFSDIQDKLRSLTKEEISDFINYRSFYENVSSECLNYKTGSHLDDHWFNYIHIMSVINPLNIEEYSLDYYKTQIQLQKNFLECKGFKSLSVYCSCILKHLNMNDDRIDYLVARTESNERAIAYKYNLIT